ncbi:DUF3592 domain-containing protein [Saccharibacillus kuerlensis]|uniref:DUF3592 domain-containing protein n=1 Tax=Saccharibacillus kuerlensis TaxID=459527 RepID=A0ABQ2L4H5_9BACL|nr:DUF3592 domain-containing protein [Saccharibacillus kuerlensis]GGO02332.1 hypothetical protein GCM10010969_25530 [Saccharibacillus kuerlensis]
MNGSGSEMIFWILGAAFIMFGVYSGIRQRKLAQSEHTVQGEIIRYEEMPDAGIERGSTGIKYHPVVRFQTHSGTVEHMARTGNTMRPPEVGTKVEVHYDPNDPAAFEMLGGDEAVRRQNVPIVLGVVFLAIGFALLF